MDKFPVDLVFSSDPGNASTTDTIFFEVKSDAGDIKDGSLFYRWDWNNDTIWDTEFSALNSFQKRFLVPGDYSINLQYADGKGKVQDYSKQIKISQGTSSPEAKFSVSPSSGNYFQKFYFDASLTYDAEDSLENLLFKWDLDGDGYWERDFDTIYRVEHIFSSPGEYSPNLIVKDPSNKFASYSEKLYVDKTDSLIRVKVSWPPGALHVGDTIQLNTSETFYELDKRRDFKSSWKVPFSTEWTDPVYDKSFNYVLRTEGVNKVECKIILDISNLENSVIIELIAGRENLPPQPAFVISIPYGNTETQFYFNCWSSSDDHTAPTSLLHRWDWNSDGNWDTPYTFDKEFYHQFDQPGSYTITLQAKDEQTKTSITQGSLNVSHFDNVTGHIEDIRDNQLYGTVKIGSQWWMAENLNFDVPEKTESGLYTTRCLFEEDEWCEKVGKMYHLASIVDDQFDNKRIDVCPSGWRIPSKSDWDVLFEELGGTSNAKELLFGESADFNGVFLGYGSYYFEGFPVITDTVYTFHDTFKSMQFASSSLPYDPNHARSDIYTVKLSRSTEELWAGYVSLNTYLPVRCIKE